MQGKQYYAAYIPTNIVQTGIQNILTNGKIPRITFTNISGADASIMPTGFQYQATLNLPKVTITANGKNASEALVGQKATVIDVNNKVLGSITLKKEWVTVTKDASTAGTYSYALNTAGKQALKAALPTNTHLTLFYKYDTNATANVIINAQEAALTVNYVDQSTGKVVKSDTSIKGTVGSTGTYQVAVPAGYQLATGQSKTLNYKITADDSDNLTVKVTKIPDDESSSSSSSASSAASSSSTSSASSSSSSASSNSSASAASSSSSSSTSSSSASSSASTPNTSSSSKANSASSGSRGKQDTATVVIIDDTTGKVLDTSIYSGYHGSTVPVDFSAKILDLLRAGYNVVQDDTLAGSVQFNDHDAVYHIHLQKSATVPFQNRLAPASASSHPADQTKTKKARVAQDAIGVEDLTHAALLHRALSQQKTHVTPAPTSVQGHLPVTLDNSLENFLNSHGGAGGGNDDLDDPDLGAFFKALSGKINFGQTPD